MRHKFTRDECQRGGRARASQASFVEACRKGFERTMETHPFYARKHLKKKIKAFNAAKQTA